MAVAPRASHPPKAAPAARPERAPLVQKRAAHYANQTRPNSPARARQTPTPGIARSVIQRFVTKGTNGQQYDMFQRLLNEFTGEGQRIISENRELAETLRLWIEDKHHHTLTHAIELIGKTLGSDFLDETLDLSPEDRISDEATAALELLEELTNACPSRKPTDDDMAAGVKYLVNKCLRTLNEEKKKFDGSKQNDRLVLAYLRYNLKWQIPGYVSEKAVHNVADFLQALEEAHKPKLVSNESRIDPTHVEKVKGLIGRCLALHKVGGSTELQKAKQINTANAKMVNEIESVLAGYVLSSSDRELFQAALKKIQGRISEAASTNGADFKSCDSAGISTETQIGRAENHCK
jgi:hypothetical protein